MQPPQPAPQPDPRRQQQYLDILEDVFRSRTLFFREPRSEIERTSFFYTETAGMQLLWHMIYPEVVRPILQPTIQQINITFPDNVWDPVEVRASPEQIEESILPAEVSENRCAICQEELTSESVKLRNCNHCYHNSCIRTWFETSVYCPTCRNDIRTSPEDTTNAEDGSTDDWTDGDSDTHI